MTEQMPNVPIAIDGRMLAEGGTGVATYAKALRSAIERLGVRPLVVHDRSTTRLLASAGPIERRLRWLDVLHDRPRKLRFDGRQFRARDIFRLAQAHFNRHHSLLRLQTAEPPGIMHWTYPIPLRLEGWANLYTVHDAIPITHPDLTPIDGERHLAILRSIITAQGRLVTVSEAARADVAAILGGDADIVCCETGITVSPSSKALPPALEPSRYFLSIGSVEPRKNLVRIAEAHRASGSTSPLVIAGPAGWNADEIETSLALFPGVVRMAYPTRDELMALIANARALLFPSLAEGFGLPIVEAMTLGTPVLTSRGGATGEIAGSAALLVSPTDIGEMAIGITLLDTDDRLRQRLADAGRERARSFTTDVFAHRLATLYRTVAAIRRG
jgi:glycosyltransferase involved in cell wall biosynthesis